MTKSKKRIHCLGCNGITERISSDWKSYWDKKPRKCYVKWVEGNPVKGCSYGELKDNYYKEVMDKILKGEIK